MKTLETERLILRGFTPDDADDVYAYAQNKNVGPNAGWQPHDSKEASERVVRMFIQEDNVWAVQLKENNQVIGSVGIHRDEMRSNPHARSIGYVLNEAYWNRGLMTEAIHTVLAYCFETLHLDIVSARYYPYNLRSRRVMEKCGMREEGTLRRAALLYNETLQDVVCFSITDEEWRTSQSST